MGTHFDAMCRFAEAQTGPAAETFKATMRSISIVEFAESPLPKFFTDDSLELFRLPWKAVAVEDPISCVGLERIGSAVILGNERFDKIATPVYRPSDRDPKRKTTEAVGLRTGDIFNFCITAVTNHRDTGHQTLAALGHFIFCGRCRSSDVDPQWKDGSLVFDVRTSIAQIQYPNGDLRPIKNPEGPPDLQSVLIDHIITALWQCVVMTQPSNWIMRHDVKASPKVLKKIPRSHQRPHWIVISDNERARIFRDPSKRVPVTDEKRHVTAHPRRAHYRKIGTLPDGSANLTWVRSCWVGPTETEIRGGRYRVELDL